MSVQGASAANNGPKLRVDTGAKPAFPQSDPLLSDVGALPPHQIASGALLESVGFAVTGTGADNTGDKVEIDTVEPAFPQTNPLLGTGGGALLIREGFQVTGQTASETL